MVVFWLLDALFEFTQQFDGAGELAPRIGALRRRRCQLRQRPLREGGDLVQLFFQ